MKVDLGVAVRKGMKVKADLIVRILHQCFRFFEATNQTEDKA